MALNLSTSFVARHSKIYTNLGFWFENKPSGSPGLYMGFSAPKNTGKAMSKTFIKKTFSYAAFKFLVCPLFSATFA
jgi:hypothetical protein